MSPQEQIAKIYAECEQEAELEILTNQVAKMTEKVNSMKESREAEQLYKKHPFATRLDEEEILAEDYKVPISPELIKSPLPEVTLPLSRVGRERVL